MNESNTYFRGTNPSKLLILLSIAVVGWVLVWQYWIHLDIAPIEQKVVADEVPPPPPVPDKAEEFESVTDKTTLRLRDMAAYYMLLDRARATTDDNLAREARADIVFGDLLFHPKQYRGVPVHLLGTAMLIERYAIKRQGKEIWLYAAHVITAEGGRNPIACVFENAPKGLPLGEGVNERVVFNGYFLKLNLMLARDGVQRFEPMLIGRIGWRPPPEAAKGAKKHAQANRPIVWMGLAIGVMFVISLFRWISGLRRSLSVRRAPSFLHERPTEEIAPEALAHFLDNVPDEEEGLPPRSTVINVPHPLKNSTIHPIIKGVTAARRWARAGRGARGA